MSPAGVTLGDFLENEVLPRVFERLDSAFPEFGWTRSSRGWTATDRETTKRLTGARPGRVVCNAPMGFLVHGAGPTSWAAYMNGGATPRGEDFLRVVRELAQRAGVDASALDRTPTPEETARREARDRRLSTLEAFFALAHESLHGPAGEAARAYLVERRGFREDELEGLPLGLYTTADEVREVLTKKGHAVEAIRDAGLLPPAFGDGRASVTLWPGRLVGELRDRRGSLENVWARTLTGEEPKYLYLSGAPKTDLGAFGLHEALRTPESRRDLLLVEGLVDTVSLPLRGFPAVAAIGGAGKEMTPARWEKLAAFGVRRVTLALDNDEAGREGLAAAVVAASRAENAPEVFVVDPALLGDAKDPDAFVRARGGDAFREVVLRAIPGSVFRGALALEGVTPTSPDKAKREAVARVSSILDTVTGPMAKLDHEDIVRKLADATGYTEDTLAVELAAHEKKTRTEKTREAARAAVQLAGKDLEKGTPAEALSIVADLSRKLSVLHAGEEPEPLWFDEERLWDELGSVPTGRPSGWATLDAVGVRFHAGELAVLGARPGHAKTSALVGLLWNWLRDSEEDEVFLFYSYEELERQVYRRLLSLASFEAAGGRPAWGRDEIRDFRTSPESRDQWPSVRYLEAARVRLAPMRGRFSVVRKPSWTAEEIAGHALLQKERGLRVAGVFVDYLQLVHEPKGGADRPDIAQSLTTQRLKDLAVEVDAPVVAGAQMGRSAIPEKSFSQNIQAAGSYTEATGIIRTARPDLHHLRSGGIEHAADLVLGLLNYRADYRESAAKAKDIPPVTLLEVGTLKAREGNPGLWSPLAFEGRYGLVRDMREDEEDGLRPEDPPSKRQRTERGAARKPSRVEK